MANARPVPHEPRGARLFMFTLLLLIGDLESVVNSSAIGAKTQRCFHDL